MAVRMLTDLSPTEFENLTLDLVEHLGLRNAVWRTPGRDVGRDIQGDVFDHDFSGHTKRSSWYVECKQYEGTVSWPVVWEKIAYADSNLADVLHFVTTSTLSPQAIDEVNKWNDSRRRPHVRFWGRQDLNSRLDIYPDIKIKYGLSTNAIQQIAPAFVEVSKVLLSYSNSLAAHIEFGRPVEKQQTVVCALSELIAARLSQIESVGMISTESFKRGVDEFSWLRGGADVSAINADRFATRAILAMIFAHAGTSELDVECVVAERNIKVPLATGLESLERDIQTVAFWGCLKFSRLDENTITLEVANATN
jgi:hypothetical protein